jgi:magnesium-transporting ATPase (P-type)
MQCGIKIRSAVLFSEEQRHMRRAAILSADLIISIIVVLWYQLAPWIDLYGFSVYHSRGDVWLPTPPLARHFLSGMVLTATLVFVSFFVLASFLMCIFRRFPLHEAFYGNGRKLMIKYCAFLLSSIALPFALNPAHKFGTTREFYIASAVAVSLLSFIAIVFFANLLFARLPRQFARQDLSRSAA